MLCKHHVSCTCTHGWCYATSCFLHLHTWLVLRNIMGWGGDDNVPCTCTHGRCYATSYVSCTCTHGWCFATSCFLHLHTWLVLRNIMFLALAHMVGATQHHTWSVLRNIMGWGGVGVGWGGDDNVPCTCTHGRCYATSYVSCTCTHGWCFATSCFLHLHTWLVLRNIICFLHLHTWSVLGNIMGWGGVGVGWGGDDNVPCTCKHGQCYATSCL